MHRGFVKLYRQSIENPLFKNHIAWHYFIYCLMKANHKDEKMIWNKQEMLIERGSFITGRKQSAIDTGLSEQNIRTAQKILINLKMIEKSTSKSTSKFSYITICNYSKFQENGEIVNQQTNQQLTSNQPATNQQLTTNKNEKELIRINKNKRTPGTSAYSEAFERWWKIYPKRGGRVRGKKKTEPLFNKILKSEYKNLKTATDNYSKEEYIRDPEGFLKNEYWKDFIQDAEPQDEKQLKDLTSWSE